ncbi:MAG: cutinase, partial [Mycobacterium sp.]|nr:cutinase [Mycobacterium sp.]
MGRWLAAAGPACIATLMMAGTSLTAAPASAEPEPPPPPAACPDVEVVFARGTFEAPGIGNTGQAFVDALR